MAIKNVILYSQTLPPFHVGGIETNAYHLIQFLLHKTKLNLTVITKTKRKLLFRKKLKLQYGSAEFDVHLVKKKRMQTFAQVETCFDRIGYRPSETVIYHNSLDLYKYYGDLDEAGYHQVARSGGNDLSFLQKNAGKGRAFGDAFGRLDRLFVNSEYSRSKAREVGISPAVLQVVKGGCEILGQVDSSVKRSLAIPGERPIILSCGRLVDFKGLDDALAAIAILKGRGKDPLFIMVGDGPLHQELRVLTGRLGIEDNCQFVGKVDPSRVFQYYQAADIYLSSSKDIVRDVDGFNYVHTETMGRSICEAQGCGVPVIVTDAGGSAEMLRQGETGLVVPQSNPEAIADAIESLLKDEPKRQAMSAAALEYARESLGWEAVLGQYTEVMSTLA